ncbi:MAG: hypothetical protein ACLGHN_09790 [Bacteriovoracia bacterium]
MDKKLIWLLLAGLLAAAAEAQDLSDRVRKSRPKRPNAQKTVKKEDKTFDKVILSFGVHTDFYNNIQTDTSGGVRKFDFAPTVGAGLHIPMANGFRFVPEVNWVLPRSAGESKIIKNLVMVRADFGYDPVDWFRVRMGTSLMWMNQHGRGGSTQINNGNTTSTFYYPEENRSSLNNTLDVGAEALYENWAIRLQTYIYSVFKEERRQLSYTLFLSYYWDR